MGLKITMNQMQKQLESLAKDLAKAYRGNKTASQRVRTGSVKFAKIAKIFRKESVFAEKKGLFTKNYLANKPATKKT